MKKIRIACAAALLLTLPARAAHLSLDGEWQFRQANAAEWLPATVPGCVHTDLMALGHIPDPFYGVNEKHLQWIGEKDWEYRRTFRAGEELLGEEHVELVLKGVDTYADVWVNGCRIGRCENMHRTWRFDLKPHLRSGENEIRLAFRSVFREDMPKYLDAPLRRMAWPNNDQSDIWLSPYARKAGYNYGWDWGPRLITTGIWRSVGIEAWSGLRIASTRITTRRLPACCRRWADLHAECLVLSDRAGAGRFTVRCQGRTTTAEVGLRAGENRVAMDFRVPDARLWWCNGAGEQPLYDFAVEVADDSCAAADTIRTGIRTVEIVREKDAGGRSFYVRLNGRPIFMKGANYIPTDNFPTRTTGDVYKRIVQAAAASHMNMLRVWGGGIYEDDRFYDLCDRYGVLVWQDMMFACGMFPGDEAYLKNVACEVRDNVRRLRNHPSIALWNGNNENEISYYAWGWNRTLSPSQDRIYRAELHELFYRTIPHVLEEEDPERYYHPTSPSTGYNGIGYGEGDVHFWSVWKGGWIEEFDRTESTGRFMSEYGFQSYPAMRTLESCIPPDQLYIGSEAMLSHQRARDDATRDPHYGDNQMRKYLERYLRVPRQLEDFVYASQVMQAEAVRTGIEAHRRAKPYCMGSLYWQINDCWPAASWSSLDWYGHWKMVQYAAARAFAEVIVSPFAEEGRVTFRVVSDRTAALDVELVLTAMTPDGRTLGQMRHPVHVAADGVTDGAIVELAELGACEELHRFFVVAELREKGSVIARNCFYPVSPNRYEYTAAEPEITVSEVNGGVLLTLRSPVLVRGLWLETDDEQTVFADNALTLLPGQPLTVRVETSLSAHALRRALRWHSVNDLMRQKI